MYGQVKPYSEFFIQKKTSFYVDDHSVAALYHATFIQETSQMFYNI